MPTEYAVKVKPAGAKRFQYLFTDSSLSSRTSDKAGGHSLARFTQEDRAQVRIDRERESFPGAEFEIVEVEPRDPAAHPYPSGAA